jgi:Ca2+-binding EF-hand superfamily protein
MKKIVLGMSAAALLATVAFGNDETATTQVAALDTSPAAFSKLDADKDGRVSAIEAANDSKLAGSFTQADTDKDGYLSTAEFQSLSGSMDQSSTPSTAPSTAPSDTTTPPADTTTPPQQ